MSERDRRNARAYVHLQSNRVVLTGEEFVTHYRQIATGRYPTVLIPRFVHEATHHATFHMPLCLALSFELSEAEIVSLHPDTPRDGLIGPARRYLLPTLVHRALSPLLEGMACFAEYDLRPGTSTTLSQPSSTLATLLALGRLAALGPGVHFWNNDAGALLERALHEASRAPQHLAMRESLLKSSYDPLLGPHLFGYVFFKALWQTAKARTQAFADPELFLSFVLEHVFADAGAVAALLEPCVDVPASVAAVLNRVAVRLKEVACDAQDRAAANLNVTSGKRAKSAVHLELERRIEDRLNRTRQAWFQKGHSAELARRQARQLAFRDYISLGSLRVAVTYDGKTTVSAKSLTGELLQQATVFANCELADEQEGWLEVLFSSYRGLLAAVVSLDGRGTVAAAMLLRDALPGELEDALGAYPGCIDTFENDARLAFDACMDDAITHICAKERQGARDQVTQWIMETYCSGLDLELFGKAPELWQWRAVLGAGNGFEAILDDGELRALAAVALSSPADPNEGWLNTALGEHGDALLQRLARKLQKRLATEVLTGPPWRSWL
jgi:hypothetical protein